MNRIVFTMLVSTLLACLDDSKQDAVPLEEAVLETEDIWDADGDGYLSDEDCDDSAPNINPGETEICDGQDNNCDGQIDEGVLRRFHRDDDGDGFGRSDVDVEACEAPDGMVQNGSDCNDEDAEIFPGATEVCDEIDNDCDGEIDNGLGNWWYLDSDNDGFGDVDVAQQTCLTLEGYVTLGGDCDDANDTVFPGAIEECDGLDNNCNGELDETGSTVWYFDDDGDGYGDFNITMVSCDQPVDYVSNSLDCDDLDPMQNPDAQEICDWEDNNCNGILDDNAVDGTVWYVDADSDGFGSTASTTTSCTQPVGYASNTDDCDDSRFETSPVALEFCNGIDDDCDGQTDEEDVVDFQVFYTDADGDGYGDPFQLVQGCIVPPGAVTNAQDCDDTDAAVYPYATEVCNGIDDNCNQSMDENAVDQLIYFLDSDNDGIGGTTFQLACAQPTGYVVPTGDCDDTNATVQPNASELCNGVDDNCNGSVDENIPTNAWYLDADGDSFGTSGIVAYNCLQPSGYVADTSDCDDSDATINPNAVEICNGIDDDCDGDSDVGHLGLDELCVADSCSEILQVHPNALDGEYYIEFPSGMELTECDMGSFGGGWTQVFVDDMNPPDSGWSLQQTYNCGIWGSILGGYGIISSGSVDNTISTRSVQHAEVWVEFDYIALDSWDFSGQTGLGPDFAYANFNNTSILYSDFDNHLSIYGEVCGWNRGYYGSYDSRLYVSSIQAGTFTNFDLTIGSTLNQNPWDESFGFDDVYVWVR